MMKRCNLARLSVALCIGLCCVGPVPAQNNEPINGADSTLLRHSDNTHRFRSKQLIAPLVLTGVGVADIAIKPLKRLNTEWQKSFSGRSPIHADNYLQYAPMVAVYGLNLCGVKGAHNFRDRTMILATSCLIMSASVAVLKKTTGELRPDGSACNSFPSGHTATAFMGAEFLRMEYKDTAPWLGIAGYGVATVTGLLRVYNNRHYLSDIIAGAGIGILSTKVAYWVYPIVQRAVFGHRHSTCSVSALPYYDVAYNSLGIGCALRF